MTENKFKSEGEWQVFGGSLMAVFERATPAEQTQINSALGHRSRTHVMYDLTSLNALSRQGKFSEDDARHVEATLIKYPAMMSS